MAETDRLTVLVADDSRVILKAFSRVMEEQYDLVEAKDGQIAWEQIEENDDICAVFTDWEMPHLNGIELTEKIRASNNPRIKALPVIMVTSKTEDDSTKEVAYTAGATDFVSKPFDTTELLARAKAHVKPIDISSGEEETQKAVMNPDNRIGNTQYFQQQGVQMISFANRHNLPMALILISVDNSKDLTKKAGANSKQYDEFILSIGTYISSVMRKDDSLARLGKSVFGLLLSSSDFKLAGKFALKLQKSINRHHIKLNHKSVKITLSVGMEVTGPSRKRKLPGMIKAARERLSVAAKTGNAIRPALKSQQQLRRLDSLDKALSLVVNKRADDVDMTYVMKRLLPLLVGIDKQFDTQIAQAALPIIKGEKKQKKAP